MKNIALTLALLLVLPVALYAQIPLEDESTTSKKCNHNLLSEK
jgi:hypothetical protein